VILTQTERDKDYYSALGGRSVVVTDNIKYCANPLPCDQQELETLLHAIGSRPVWVYASTHKGEEELALETHLKLSADFPDLLTIVAPRHPERSPAIESFYEENGVTAQLRSKNQLLQSNTQIYLVDRLGELGLFYRAAPIACIGRSFSDDGGGGHNPLEAALLGAAVLHGPNVQNLQEIFDQMDQVSAALPLSHKSDLATRLQSLFHDPSDLKDLQHRGYDFAIGKSHILDRVIEELEPVFMLAHLPVLTNNKG
jgi:3-deoxy-D-manno-octulosonic-acid transferase